MPNTLSEYYEETINPSLNDVLAPWLKERGWTDDYWSLGGQQDRFSTTGSLGGPMGLHGYNGLFMEDGKTWYKRGGHHLTILNTLVFTCERYDGFNAASPTFLEDLEMALDWAN